MSHHIPTDLIIEILACLPVKSLLRFTSVCKDWYSIIKNPSFVDTHRNSFGKTSSDQLLVKLRDSEGFFLLPINEKNDNVLLDFPFHGLKQGSVCLQVVNSCNGIICLYDTDLFSEFVHDVIIWNPCVRKSVTIPPPKNPSDRLRAVGFGFDLVKNIFKVVMILHTKNEVRSRVDVYDQGGKEWRPIGLAPPHYSNVWFPCGSQYFFHGAVHWVAANRYTNVRSIVAFEIGDEVFKDIALPKCAETCDLSISSFKDSLMVIGGWWERNSILKITEWHVWMMRDYGVLESWTNLYYIILPTRMDRPMGFRKNGEILFARTNNMVMSLDPDTIVTTNISIMGQVASSAVLNFVESLVLFT